MGIVVMKRSDYISSVASLFSDASRSKLLDTDPTLTRPNSLQSFLCTLRQRGEISQSDYDFLRPKAAHFGRAYGLPKVHKHYNDSPPFRPIIDTTGTPHYNVGKWSGVIKFYRRYVDDTLVLIKPSDIPEILNKFNTFDKNIQFTIDTFPDNVIHFLDILISSDNTDVYNKSTHTGQYTHFSSFEPFFRKIAWVKSLFHRASKLCSTSQLFENQIRKLKMFMSWNCYPRAVRNLVISKLKHKFSTNQ